MLGSNSLTETGKIGVLSFFIITFQRDGSISVYHLQSTMNKTTPSLCSSAFLFDKKRNVSERS